MEEKKDFDWRLTWPGMKDNAMNRAVFESMKDFPLMKDSKAKLINFNQYQFMVKEKVIAEPQSHWQIKENQIGMISQSYYRTYTTTWYDIHQAHSDFLNGWRACEKNLNK